MNRQEITKAFKELNTEFASNDEYISLIICGGASTAFVSNNDISSKDIDFLSPGMSESLKRHIETVAKKLSMSEMWLNDHSKAFAETLPSNWESRVKEILSFSHLAVFSLSRQDLISSKMKAQIDRGFDLKDLIDIRPSDKEIEKAKNHCEKFALSDLEKFDLNQTIEEIKEARDV